MSGPDPRRLNDIKVDVNALYREETFTDLKVATIRRLSPVKPDGSPDPSREAIFTAQTHVMTQGGPLPIQCPLEARTLEGAVAEFPQAVKQAVAEVIERVRELQRQEAPRIVVPKSGPGNIQLP